MLFSAFIVWVTAVGFQAALSLPAESGFIPPAMHWPQSSIEDPSATPEGTQDEYWTPQSKSKENQNKECKHGKLERGSCACYPCWQGEDCDTYVDNYSPRFLVHKATSVVPVNVTGPTYRAWASDEDLGLTCPLGPGEAARCPCAQFTYQLFSPSGDHRFALHPTTGVLRRRKIGELRQGKTYKYKLMVQSILVPGYSTERLYDILDLDIYVGPTTLITTPWI